MISYVPLWKTMKKKGVSTYALRYKHEMGGGTVQRLQAGESVSTNTLNALCKILDCGLQDIVVYMPDPDGRKKTETREEKIK